MNDRTSVLFLVLCVAALLALVELEKIWEEEKLAKKQQKITQIKKIRRKNEN